MLTNLSECGRIMRILGNDLVSIYAILLPCARRHTATPAIAKKNKDSNQQNERNHCGITPHLSIPTVCSEKPRPSFSLRPNHRFSGGRLTGKIPLPSIPMICSHRKQLNENLCWIPPICAFYLLAISNLQMLQLGLNSSRISSNWDTKDDSNTTVSSYSVNQNSFISSSTSTT